MTITVDITTHDGVTRSITVTDDALRAVCFSHNVKSLADVDDIKIVGAALIMLCERQRSRGIGKVAREAALGITHTEDAVMRAVKAGTYGT